jgi:hypothetical protein
MSFQVEFELVQMIVESGRRRDQKLNDLMEKIEREEGALTCD